MATRYVQDATNQLKPGYTEQINAAQSQIPAIQQLYGSLIQGLRGQQQVEDQNILENASGRGLLRSTIPVDKQAQLGQTILQKQGEYGAQQAEEIGKVNLGIAGIKTEQAQAIADLANALWQRSNQQRQVDLQRSQFAQQFNLQKKLANRQYQLDLVAARNGF